jgi:hypothetical protein
MEAHIKGHANDIPDDENADEMMHDRSSNANHQQPETKHSILLNTPSTSSSTTPSPNSLISHPAVTKYESNEGSNLMNFAEQFTIMNSASSAATAATSTSANAYPDTPKDSEASSEQNSDGDDAVTYMNMYSRFEQNVVNQYGVIPLANATLQPITPTSNNATNAASSSSLITLKPIQQQSYDLARNNTSPYFNVAAASSNVQQSNDYK